MSGDIGILTGITIASSLWDKIKNYASQKEDASKSKIEAELLAKASVNLKEERAWWEVLLFSGRSGGAAGCGYGLERGLNKPRDAGTDGDGGDGDGGDGGPECNNFPGSFNLSSPPDSNSATSLRPTFDWTDSIDPDPGDTVGYSLLIDTDNLFPAPITYTDISASEFTLSTPLANNTTYYWKVIAKDLCNQETESAETFNFTTVVECSTSPNAFSLTSPANGSTDVSITPTFDWEDAIDPDVGDAVTYTLQIDTSDLFPAPTEFTDLTESTYTMTTALANGTTYYWRVIAKDGCDNEVTSTGVYSFTTEAACLPQTYYDTDFLAGVPSDTVVNSGTVSLVRDDTAWTCYDGSVDPATVGWSENAPLGWTINSITGGILHLSSIDLDTNAYYGINPSFVGSGWMVEARMQLDPVNGSQGGTGCAIDIKDGSHSVILRIQNNQINEDGTGEFYVMDPTLDFNIYKITKSGGTFSVFVNDIFRLGGTAISDSIASRLWYHDIGGTFDSDAHWDYICYYNGGSSLPYVGNGTYTSEIIDTGSSANNIGSGAMLHWSQNTPSGTSITMSFCASNDPGLAGATCANGLTNYTGETIPAGVVGRYFQWVATLATTDPINTSELLDVTLNFETCD